MKGFEKRAILINRHDASKLEPLFENHRDIPLVITELQPKVAPNTNNQNFRLQLHDGILTTRDFQRARLSIHGVKFEVHRASEGEGDPGSGKGKENSSSNLLKMQ